MSDVVLLAAPIIAFLGTVLTAVMAYLMAKLNQKQERAAVEVRQVKRVLETRSSEDTQQMSELLQIAHDTHTLVNSNMAVQLKISALALRRVADLEDTEENRQAAALAETSYAEHEKKQASVDAGKKP